jgi:hypothetical protein
MTSPSSDSSSRSPTLLDRLRARIGVKHGSIRAESAYVQCPKRYIYLHGIRHQKVIDKLEYEAFMMVWRENVTYGCRW